MTGDVSTLKRLYEPGTRSSAARALEHEMRKVRYVHAWASKRKASITRADAYLQVKSISLARGSVDAVVWQSLNVRYTLPGQVVGSDVFGIRTRHKVTLVRRRGKWVIRADEYTDPLGEDTLAPEVAPASALEPADPVSFVYPPQSEVAAGDAPMAEAAASRKGAYDREKAVAYADRYCGVRMGSDADIRFGYNPRYFDYTDLGGDCTNFVSQVLGDGDAGGLPMDSAWCYDYASTKGGSEAWVETDAFRSHLLSSGTARLISRGSYRDVLEPSARFPRGALAELDPGDIIAYEEEGEIQHFAVITARGPSGYPLVNTHTADRFHVPWDLGWDKNTTFWLFKIVR